MKMNEYIVKGILNELEFETELTTGKDEYKIETKMVDDKQLEMIITDPDDFYHTASVLITIGKISGEENVGLKALYKKKAWVERFPTLGIVVDNIPSVIIFLKDVARSIVREM